MKEEKDLHKSKQRGLRAKQLLKDPLILSAFSDIRTLIHRKIEQSAFKDADVREDCYRMLRSAEMFEGIFKRHINTGIAAEDRLNAAQKVVKRIQEMTIDRF